MRACRWRCKRCQTVYDSEVEPIYPGVLDPVHSYFLLTTVNKPICASCYDEMSSLVEENVGWCKANPHLMRFLRYAFQEPK